MRHPLLCSKTARESRYQKMLKRKGLTDAQVTERMKNYPIQAAIDAFQTQLNDPEVAQQYPAKDGKGWRNPFAEKGTEEPQNDELMPGIPGSKLSGIDIHETPTKLPPRDDLRRHIDESEVEKPEEPAKKISRLLSSLVIAESSN